MTPSARVDGSLTPTQPALGSTPSGVAAVPQGARDMHLDVLRAVALLGMVVAHWFGIRWAPVLLTFAPITFAVSGALLAASLDRSPADPWPVLWRRVRRLLPPLGVLVAVGIPLMLVQGWAVAAEPVAEPAFSWHSMAMWLVPLSEPSSSASGAWWTAVLLLAPAYACLTVVSPALLWLFRRWSLRTIAVPFLAIAASLSGMWDPDGHGGELLLNLATFAGCWMLGFAYHDSRIRRTAPHRVILVASILMAVGLGYAAWRGSITAPAPADIPLITSVYGAGVVLLLLRLNPPLPRVPGRFRPSPALSAVNSRTMTIFLWNYPAYLISAQLLVLAPHAPGWQSSSLLARGQQIGLAAVLLVLAVVLFGWVEDLCARRSLRLTPWPPSSTTGAERSRRPGAAVASWLGGLAAAAVAILIVPLVLLGGSIPVAARSLGAAPAPAGAPQGNEPSDTGLPPRIVAGYWQGWGEPSLRLRDIPPEYNVVMAAFAVGDASGQVTFSQSVQSDKSFTADVDELNAAGRPVLLSVGGWDDGGLKITNDSQRRAFVESVTEIIDAHHFQGIDWDLEHGINPVQVAAATHELTDRYGPRFLVTMAPILQEKSEQQQLDLAARIKDVLYFASPQFYNFGRVDASWIVDTALTWGEVVGQDKVAIGFMTVRTPTDTGAQSPAAVCDIWRRLLVEAPTARGVTTWSANLDKTSGYRFAHQCAAEVRG